MQMKTRKSFILLFSAAIAVLLLTCAFMFTHKSSAHADAEETHDHSAMMAINSYADIVNGELTEGAYYLGDNINGNITVTGEVTLCLNGQTITGSGNGSVITVSGDATLTLCDCKGTGTITCGTISGNTASEYGGGVFVGGTFTMTGGTISGNTASEYGGGVFVERNGVFEMMGGTISGNTAGDGDGVFVGGTFTMTGGTISGNTASGYGGGVFVEWNGAFEMTGGTISGNTASKYGGGVFVGGTFTMTGGMISGNTAVDGGGVYAEAGTFTMTGGTISGNTTVRDGGGVLVEVMFKMTGGTISGNTVGSGGGGVYVQGTFEIKGAPIITGNKNSNNVDDNVYFIGAIIAVTGELTDSAKICVSNTGEIATGFTQGDKASKYFIPDNPENCVYVSTETSGTVTVAEQHDIITHEAKQPTCTEKGWEAYGSCSRCDYATDKVEIDALSHTEVSDDNAVAANCTQTGLTASTHCSICDTVLQEQTTVTALGHSYGEWTVVKQATESEEGEERRVCENDNTHYETRTIPKLTPSTPAEGKSYWWLFWLLIPLAIGVGGVTLGIWVYKNDKKNNRL